MHKPIHFVNNVHRINSNWLIVRTHDENFETTGFHVVHNDYWRVASRPDGSYTPTYRSA